MSINFRTLLLRHLSYIFFVSASADIFIIYKRILETLFHYFQNQMRFYNFQDHKKLSWWQKCRVTVLTQFHENSKKLFKIQKKKFLKMKQDTAFTQQIDKFVRSKKKLSVISALFKKHGRQAILKSSCIYHGMAGWLAGWLVGWLAERHPSLSICIFNHKGTHTYVLSFLVLYSLNDSPMPSLPPPA